MTLAYSLARWKNHRKHKVRPLKDEDWAREERFDLWYIVLKNNGGSI